MSCPCLNTQDCSDAACRADRQHIDAIREELKGFETVLLAVGPPVRCVCHGLGQPCAKGTLPLAKYHVEAGWRFNATQILLATKVVMGDGSDGAFAPLKHLYDELLASKYFKLPRLPYKGFRHTFNMVASQIHNNMRDSTIRNIEGRFQVLCFMASVRVVARHSHNSFDTSVSVGVHQSMAHAGLATLFDGTGFRALAKAAELPDGLVGDWLQWVTCGYLACLPARVCWWRRVVFWLSLLEGVVVFFRFWLSAAHKCLLYADDLCIATSTSFYVCALLCGLPSLSRSLIRALHVHPTGSGCWDRWGCHKWWQRQHLCRPRPQPHTWAATGQQDVHMLRGGQEQEALLCQQPPPGQAVWCVQRLPFWGPAGDAAH